MFRSILCAAACATALISALALSAAPASAGTYTVYSCGGPAGATNNLFRAQADAGMTAYYASCPNNPYAGSDDMGLEARTVRQNANVGWLSGAYLIMDTPAGATVGAIHFDTNMDKQGGTNQYWSDGVVGFGTDGDRGINTNQAQVWGCGSNNTNLCFYVGHVDLAINKPSVRFEVRCGNPSFGTCPTQALSTANAYISAYNISVDVNDYTNPSISSVGGGLASAGWERGQQSIVWNSSDNSGIRSASLSIDGTGVTSWNNSCDYTQVKPCSDLSGGSLSYNTDALTDGAHTLTLYVTDASGNQSSWSNTIRVDHTAPAAPSVSAAGGWQNTNSFQATVTNASGQYAPVTAVYYQICDSTGANCGAVKSATASSGASGGQTTLSGITLPADGDYTVRAYEQDSVGNVSSANLSNAATAHELLDRVAPTAPTALAVDGNGIWQSTNSFRLAWTNPPGQLAPITKAYIVECDISNTCNTTSQSASDINQASSVTVPLIGDYSTTVYLQDAAGNTTVANKSSAVHLRFDDTVPGTAVPTKNNGWLNADQAKAYGLSISYPQGQPQLPSGVAGYSLTDDGSDPDATIAVTTSGPGADNTWPASETLTDLPEGTVTVEARAISGSGVAGTTFGVTTLKVDKTVPFASADGAPDPGTWQTSAVRFAINAADALSGMATAPQNAPVTSGGYISYRVDDGQPLNIAGPTAQAVVDSDGVHTVYYRAYDVAGNPSPEQSVKVRIDVTAPIGSFEARNADDPRTFVADVQDAASGVAGGTIQIRPQGGDWQPVPTTYDGAGHLAAKIDDARIAQGSYAMRALVTDHAGNQGVVDTRADGSQMQVDFPLRGSVTLSASTQVVAVTSCRTVKITRLRRGHKVHKRVRICKATKLPAKARGKRIVVRPKVTKTRYVFVHLKDAAGNPIKNAPVTMEEQPATGGGFADKAHVATDATGDLRYAIAKSGPSRTIRATFEGTDTLLPGSADVTVVARASTTLTASKKSLRPGGRIVFRGRLAGGYVPAAGKLVNLQVFFRSRWRTFATPRAAGSGAWKFTYRFTARYARPLTYRFRVLVPVEQAYPFAAGNGTRMVRVVVRP